MEQLKEKNTNIYVLDQFTNPANPEAHFTSTGIIYAAGVFVICDIIQTVPHILSVTNP